MSFSQGPLVSVALCTYNGSRFLAEQIESVIQQTHRNLEIVIADDCSNDASLIISEKFAATDARVRVVRNPQNLGFEANFWNAMRLCNGQFIAPCDQDDIWEPDKISRLLESIGQKALSYCDSILIDSEGVSTGVRMSKLAPARSIDDPSPFAFGNCVSGHAMLFRRELLSRNSSAPAYFFYDWWIAAVAAASGGIVFCPQTLVRYRQHGSNITDQRVAEMQVEAGLRPATSLGTTRSGYRLQYLRETGDRLTALARLPGNQQGFLMELARLWRARESQWLSPTLGFEMMRHRERLLALTGFSQEKSRKYCREFFFGLRWLRMTKRQAYSDDA